MECPATWVLASLVKGCLLLLAFNSSECFVDGAVFSNFCSLVGFRDSIGEFADGCLIEMIRKLVKVILQFIEARWSWLQRHKNLSNGIDVVDGFRCFRSFCYGDNKELLLLFWVLKNLLTAWQSVHCGLSSRNLEFSATLLATLKSPFFRAC